MGFNESTRQNLRTLNTSAFSSGNVSTVPLPQVGILARLHVHVTGVMTVTLGAGTAVLSSKGPWALIRKLRYQIGNGVELVNISGHGLYVEELFSRLGYEPEDGQIGSASAAEVYNAPVVAGANNWEFGFTVPITINERDMIGYVLLQAQGTQTQLVLEWNTAGGATFDFPVVLASGATATFVGTAEIAMESFSAPANTADFPPLDRLYQTLEFSQPIASVGEQTVKLLEENIYTRIIHIVEVNGALSSTAVERMMFRYNMTDVPKDISRKMAQQLTRRNWTKDFPVGVFYHDFFDQGYPNFGGDRDLVEAQGLAELESLLTIASGTTLGSGNNNIRTITQSIVPIAVPMPALAR